MSFERQASIAFAWQWNHWWCSWIILHYLTRHLSYGCDLNDQMCVWCALFNWCISSWMMCVFRYGWWIFSSGKRHIICSICSMMMMIMKMIEYLGSNHMKTKLKMLNEMICQMTENGCWCFSLSLFQNFDDQTKCERKLNK